jgi:hypothetical protein
MNARDNLMTARFLLNMERIHGLCTMVWSEVDVLKPTGLFRTEGPRADILRAIVVFLHATFEDVLRTRARQDNKNFTLYSGRDIDKALRKGDLDPAPFKPLYPPLRQMAKRRNRIVHEADLSKKTDIASEAWTIADDWQLIMWLVAVPAFHSRLCMSIDNEDQVARATYSKLREAMDGVVGFGWQLVAFPKTPPDTQTKALQNILDTIKTVSTLLAASKNARNSVPSQ